MLEEITLLVLRVTILPCTRPRGISLTKTFHFHRLLRSYRYYQILQNIRSVTDYCILLALIVKLLVQILLQSIVDHLFPGVKFPSGSQLRGPGRSAQALRPLPSHGQAIRGEVIISCEL